MLQLFPIRDHLSTDFHYMTPRKPGIAAELVLGFHTFKDILAARELEHPHYACQRTESALEINNFFGNIVLM